MKRSIAPFFLLLSIASAPAWGERPGQYLGVSFGSYAASPAGVSGDLDETDIGFRLGYHFFDFIGIEGRFGTNAQHVTNDGDADTPDTEYAGLFLRLDLPFERANTYLLLGGSTVRFNGVTVDEDDYEPVAAGVGIELYGSERTAVTLEYVTYSDDAYRGLGVGLKHHFNMPSFR